MQIPDIYAMKTLNIESAKHTDSSTYSVLLLYVCFCDVCENVIDTFHMFHEILVGHIFVFVSRSNQFMEDTLRNRKCRVERFVVVRRHIKDVPCMGSTNVHLADSACQ